MDEQQVLKDALAAIESDRQRINELFGREGVPESSSSKVKYAMKHGLPTFTVLTRCGYWDWYLVLRSPEPEEGRSAESVRSSSREEPGNSELVGRLRALENRVECL